MEEDFKPPQRRLIRRGDVKHRGAHAKNEHKYVHDKEEERYKRVHMFSCKCLSEHSVCVCVCKVTVFHTIRSGVIIYFLLSFRANRAYPFNQDGGGGGGARD